jgi:hypothetical protein
MIEPDALVCAKCGEESCWSGRLYCENYRTASICTRAEWEANGAPPASAPETSERCGRWTIMNLLPGCELPENHGGPHRAGGGQWANEAPPPSTAGELTRERQRDCINGIANCEESVVHFHTENPGTVHCSNSVTKAWIDLRASRDAERGLRLSGAANAETLVKQIQEARELLAHAQDTSRRGWSKVDDFERERDAERAEKERLEAMIDALPHKKNCDGFYGDPPCTCYPEAAKASEPKAARRGEGK